MLQLASRRTEIDLHATARNRPQERQRTRADAGREVVQVRELVSKRWTSIAGSPACSLLLFSHNIGDRQVAI